MKKERKRKALAATVCGSMLAIALVGGTLAYLQDDDSDVNVMTLGNVSIDQHEYERVQNADGTYEMVTTASGTGYKLQEFTQAKPLLPGVGSITGWGTTVYADQLGTSKGGLSVLEGMENVQDKFVSVENTGKSDAYVRTLIAFEQGTMSSEQFDGLVMWSLNDYSWDINEIGTIAVDNNNYYLFELVYDDSRIAGEEGVLPAGAFTSFSLGQVYLKSAATNDDCVALDGNNNGTYDILVFSQAVQTNGFADAQTALDTAFGDITTTNHPWINGVEIPTAVASADELTSALEAGKSVYLTENIVLEDQPIAVAAGKVATLNLNGHTLSGKSTSDTTSNLIKVNSGASLTIENGTVSFYATNPDTEWGGEGQPPYPGYANNTISNLGTLVIDGATIENVTAPGGASYAIDCYQGSELIVNSGKIDGQGKCAIRMFCNSNTLSTDVTINGGVITGKRAIWVQLPGSNIANVRPVNLTINGGELICTNTEADLCIYSYSYGDSFANTNITITGGTFTGDVAFGGGNAKSTQENVTITGGTFNGKLGRYLANDGWEDIAKP